MLFVDVQEKRFGERPLLGDIRFWVDTGQFVSLIGPSGCGKSTLLSLIAGLQHDYVGRIAIDRESIGMMFQEPLLLPWLTVEENIAVVAKHAFHKDIVDMLAMVGLERYKDYYPKALSGGIARRAVLVRAFINRPKVIMLDEPFISLDQPTALALQKDLMKFCRTFNPAVILVTHNLDEAIMLSQRILFLGGDVTHEIFSYAQYRSGFETLTPEEVQIHRQAILEQHPDILKGITCKQPHFG